MFVLEAEGIPPGVFLLPVPSDVTLGCPCVCLLPEDQQHFPARAVKQARACGFVEASLWVESGRRCKTTPSDRPRGPAENTSGELSD